MKAKLIITALFVLVPLTPASANDAWIKVDANGNAIGGAVVCSQDVCGDSNSVYSQLTLQPGERYVLQFKGDPVSGNVAGISADQPNIKMQVNLETNEWTKTTQQTVIGARPEITNEKVTVSAGTERVETWNPTILGRELPQPAITINEPQTTISKTITEDVVINNETTEFFAWYFWDWSDFDAWLQWFWMWLEELGFGDLLS